MSRYIDADELLLKIDLHGTNKFGMLDEDIREFIRSIPPADMAESVGKYNGLTAVEQLNLYRNKYYSDGNATERGIIANAINDVLPRLLKGDKT